MAFVSENKKGNFYSGSGIKPAKEGNIAIYRKEQGEHRPSLLIDSKNGNIDIRDKNSKSFLEVDAEKKRVRLNGSDLTTPVGSIISSFLSEDQFRKQSDDWVLCDGRSVVGTRYHQLGFGNNVPDTRGMFLRSSGGASAPVGHKQDHTTSAKGLKARSQASPETADPGFEVFWKLGVDSWVKDRAPSFIKNWSRKGGFLNQGNESYSGSIGSVDETYRTRFNPQPHTHSVQTSISSDDSETRPVNITVNRFIKVN